jgi:Flp pilus assembly secretin CpaC
MRGWVKSRTLITVAVLAMAGLQACNPRRVPLSDEFKEAMANWSAGKAIDDALRRQIEAPDQSDSMRGTHHPLAPGEPIWIQSGKSRIVHFSSPVRRVSISDPDLAGIVVLGPSTLLINAKLPKEAVAPAAQPVYNISASDAGVLSSKPLTPAPTIFETSLVIWDQSGTPSSHSLIVADFIDRQVMLEVTVAEINRTSLEQHGIDFRQANGAFSSTMLMGGGFGPIAGLPVGPDLLPPLIQGTDRPNFAFRLPNDDITALIQVLQSEGMATILAQPKILAMSGQYSLFQAGGEIAIPIVNAFIAQIEFKPFGTLVNFLPRVSEEGDIILTVTPEVSQPDPSLSQQFPGVNQTPSFRTRRVSTTARLRDGETLVLGGLMQTQRLERVRGIPYLQDIPIAGYAFRDTSFTDEVTELMVVVTPHIVNPIPAGETVALPTDRPPLTMEEVRTKPEPQKAARPRFPGLGTPGTLPGLP